MGTPLLVHLVFHPSSTTARALVLEMNRALNEDPAVPGLRVATVFGREDGTGLPPREHDLDEGDNSVAVFLAEDEMVIEPTALPAGRQTWAAMAVDLWQQCYGVSFTPSIPSLGASVS